MVTLNIDKELWIRYNSVGISGTYPLIPTPPTIPTAPHVPPKSVLEAVQIQFGILMTFRVLIDSNFVEWLRCSLLDLYPDKRMLLANR
jgi:hypothetical protein